MEWLDQRKYGKLSTDRTYPKLFLNYKVDQEEQLWKHAHLMVLAMIKLNVIK